MTLVQLTLYEIFGYVFPGATALAGVCLLYWTFVLPANQDWSTLSSGGWAALLAIAYVFGHFVQASANCALKWFHRQPESRVFNQDIPAAIRSVLADRALKAVGLEQENLLTDQTVRQRVGLEQGARLSAEVIYDIADHAVLQRGKTETRDVYVYREGFYRGMTLGLLLFAIGCIGFAVGFGRMTAPPASLAVLGVIITMTPLTLATTGLIALAMTYLSLERYWHFSRYRVKYAFYSFIVAPKAMDDSEQ